MSRPTGSVPLTGYIYTTDDSDVFPTHLDLLGKGGYRIVDTLSARDLITSQRKTDGMLVYVEENLTLYQLLNSSTNTYTSVYQIVDNKPKFDITLDLTEGKIFVGNSSNVAAESNILLDILASKFILEGEANSNFPNSISLSSLTNGYLYSEDGILSTREASGGGIPDLTAGKVFVGDSDNKAEARQTINYNNMPELGLAIDVPIPGVSHFLGQVYLGTESGVPTTSNSLAIAVADITNLNIWKFSAGFVVTNNLPFPLSMFNCQSLATIAGLEGGMIKVFPGGILALAVPDVDYATLATLEEIQAACEEAANAAEEAQAACQAAQEVCEEAQTVCETSQNICEEAQAACEEAQAACEAAQAACEAAQAACEAASGAAEAAQAACEAAQVACEAAQIAAELAQAEAEASAAVAATEAAAATTAAATAATSAGAAAASAATAGAAAGTATGAAGAAGASATAAAASAIAAGVSASFASGYADDAEGYKDDAERYKNHAEDAQDAAIASAAVASTKATEAATSATNALASETQAGLYEATCEGILNTILTTGLNSLPNSGDVDIQGYKIIDLADGTADTDAVNVRTMNAAISAGGTGTVSALTGFVQGTSVTNGVLTTTIGNASLDIIPANDDVSLSSHKITSLADATNDTDAVNLQTMTAAIAVVSEDLITSATGFVTAGAPVNGVMTFSRGSSCTLDVIPAANNIDIAYHKIINSYDPSDPGDLTNKSYVDSKDVSSATGFVTASAPVNGVMTFSRGSSCTLDVIPASANVSFSNYKITNIADAVDPKDATNLDTVNNLIATTAGTVSALTGFVEGTSVTNGVLTTTIGNASLDIIPANADVSFGSFKITSLADPVGTHDGANKGYVDSAISTANSAYITSVTGFVAGSAPVNGVLTLSIGDASLDTIPANADVSLSSHKITDSASPTNGGDLTNKTYVDSKDVTSATGFVTSSAPSNGVMTFSRGSSCTLDVIPTAGNISITGYKITGSEAPTDNGDLTNKLYVDTEIAVATTGGITSVVGFVEGTAPVNGVLTLSLTPGDIDLTNHRIINLQDSPEDDFDATSTNFVWNLMNDNVDVSW